MLQAYYQKLRRGSQQLQSRTTIRMLESLVRLAQAHARLCLRDTVEVMDAVVVIHTMGTSMSGADGVHECCSRERTRLPTR